MKAYIFDLDGTLLDSMGVWTQIDRDFLASRGHIATQEYIDEISALSFPEVASLTIKRFNLPDSEKDLLQTWNAMAVYAYGHSVQLKPYALEYLSALSATNVKLAIATSLPYELYMPALQNLNMLHLFDVICSTDEVARGKTSPDIYFHTANQLGVPPSQCIVFEDVLEAVLSAKLAGMTTYAVYDASSAAQWSQLIKAADGHLMDFQNAPMPK